jgi:hypothetical protein
VVAEVVAAGFRDSTLVNSTGLVSHQNIATAHKVIRANRRSGVTEFSGGLKRISLGSESSTMSRGEISLVNRIKTSLVALEYFDIPKE